MTKEKIFTIIFLLKKIIKVLYWRYPVGKKGGAL